MDCYCIGRVLKPELTPFKTKNGDKLKLTFGLLSGQTSQLFSVWSDDRAFDAATALKDGDLAIARVGFAVDNNGKLKTYLNRLAPASDDVTELIDTYFSVAAPTK